MAKGVQAIEVAADRPATPLDDIEMKTVNNLAHIITLQKCASAIVDRLRGDRLEEAGDDAQTPRSGVLGNIEDKIDDQSGILHRLQRDLRTLEQLL